MHFNCEELPNIEAPMSADWWYTFLLVAGVGAILGLAYRRYKKQHSKIQ